MTIQEAIEKAIEGGYIGAKSYEILRSYPAEIDFFSDTERIARKSLYQIFLDPLFWQSLGKAMGWEFVSKERKVEYTQNHKLNSHSQEWLYQWHRFIDHLAEGKDAESFFSNLS